MILKTVFVVVLIVQIHLTGLAFEDNSSKIIKEYSPVFSVDTAVLENDYVLIMQNSTAFGNTVTPGFGKRIIVALDKLKIKSNKGNIKLRRGEAAVFQKEDWYNIPSGSFFEVALKELHPAYLGPEEWLEPVKNKVVYEDSQFRIFEERLAPGETRPLHSHAQRVVVRLNPARLTDPVKNPGKEVKGSLQVPNTVKFAEPMVHVVKNVSDVPLFNIIIEFKYQ